VPSAGDLGVGVPSQDLMRVYPNRLGAGLRTLVKDAAVVICLLGLAWVAIKVHDEIDGLKQLGSGVVQPEFRSCLGLFGVRE